MTPPAATLPRLDPGLRPADYAPVFRRYGRLHVPDFLVREDAAALARTVEGAGGWHRAVHLETGDYDIPVEEIDELPSAERQAFEGAVQSAARDAFRYMFDVIRISDEGRGLRPVDAGLSAWLAFANTPAFLDFMRTLTGDPRIVYADAMATRYLPGHFATGHDDEVETMHRLYAYVLTLSPRWRADWGGLLLFLDEQDHVSEGYVPTFNAINIFRVPQRHAVSFVTPAADGPRLSLTGWLRSKAP